MHVHEWIRRMLKKGIAFNTAICEIGVGMHESRNKKGIKLWNEKNEKEQ